MAHKDGEYDSLFERLSDKQKDIINFIESFLARHAYPPTIREIVQHCNISSTSVVSYNLGKLEEHGWIARADKASRGIRLLRQRDPVTRVPLAGFIFASEPVPVPGDDFHRAADPDLDYVEVPRTLLRGADESEVFALRVRGDSMIDALVDDGDIVILHQQQTCRNGDMVAVWLPEREETTLKAFYDEGTRIRLQPRNPYLEPIYVHPNNCRVQGKVLGVIRAL